MCIGRSGVHILDAASEDAAVVEDMLTQTCADLAKKIARGGEGYTILVHVVVTGVKQTQTLRLSRGRFQDRIWLRLP
jgi:N-acetylglutamate synthase/N-acetylornithine aminotransferase